MQRTITAVLAFMLAASMSPPACGAAPVPQPSAARQQQLAYLLRHDCGSCHGMRLTGGLGPPLQPEQLRGKDDAALVWVVLNGRPGSAMPPWRGLLDETDARWLIHFLKSNHDERSAQR